MAIGAEWRDEVSKVDPHDTYTISMLWYKAQAKLRKFGQKMLQEGVSDDVVPLMEMLHSEQAQRELQVGT